MRFNTHTPAHTYTYISLSSFSIWGFCCSVVVLSCPALAWGKFFFLMLVRVVVLLHVFVLCFVQLVVVAVFFFFLACMSSCIAFAISMSLSPGSLWFSVLVSPSSGKSSSLSWFGLSSVVSLLFAFARSPISLVVVSCVVCVFSFISSCSLCRCFCFSSAACCLILLLLSVL